MPSNTTMLLTETTTGSQFYLPGNTTEAATLATRALFKEVCLTPKPGLVDRINAGAHRDMDFDTFMVSIAAISRWFDEFYYAGYRHRMNEISTLLPVIRPVGIACEQEMFAATQGINTHKGAIFSLGLLCAVIGYLNGQQQTITTTTICNNVAAACHDLISELTTASKPHTAGERLYQQYGFTGARGEAASGFNTVRQYSLPAYLQLCAAGHDEQTALLQALMLLMVHNDDTNVVSRGGLDGLRFVQQHARTLLQQHTCFTAANLAPLVDFDRQLTARYLSPGGSADLLAVTWFLAHYAS